MKIVVAFVLGALLGGPAVAAARAGWNHTPVLLEWNKRPSPDETGSSRQATPLLAEHELEYTRRAVTESYEVRSGSLSCSVMLPKGTPFSMIVGGDEGFYDIDRTSGRAAKVVWHELSTPADDPLTRGGGPNG